jgi:phage repressor protein C with HTH and peptisase S24 domain
METKTDYIKRIYNLAALRGLCETKKEFAGLLEVNDKGLSAAMNGNERHLTDSLLKKVRAFATQNGLDGPEETAAAPTDSILVIPYGARGGTIGDFVDGVRGYECEKVVSPVKGADYAMEVTGDSMSPDFPSGSRILIKKIDETAFIAWNEVYVLDTPNGAVIKRVRRTEDPAVVECVSINPAYQPYRIERDFIRGWYRVLMVMSLK